MYMYRAVDPQKQCRVPCVCVCVWECVCASRSVRPNQPVGHSQQRGGPLARVSYTTTQQTNLEGAGLAAEVQPSPADPHVLGLYSRSLGQGHVPGGNGL